VVLDHSQKAVAAARDMQRRVQEAEVRVGDMRDRMISAFRSRDVGVRALRRIAELHEERAHSFSCGRRGECDTGRVVSGPWPRRMIAKLIEQERRERGHDFERGEFVDFSDDETG
jgi:hypothetical protein